ncbi:bcl-2-related ovarian killer protein isoform X1 [Orcinus orca]|uniref:bcl-2-related ovarian killer protein isoform X1 n=1 Tax=Orcinus orca TaxID=9733 RepID=UPI0014419FA0|nr:bcl-2-related ovarian killer protein isoform X1 [Orcinus orca]
MEVLRRSSVFAAEIMDAFDRSPTDKELVAQAKALGREFVHARLLRAGLAWSAPERAAPAPGGRLAEVCTVLLRLADELELIRPSVYRNVARQLNIPLQSETVVTDAFLAVAAQIVSAGRPVCPGGPHCWHGSGSVGQGRGCSAGWALREASLGPRTVGLLCGPGAAVTGSPVWAACPRLPVGADCWLEWGGAVLRVAVRVLWGLGSHGVAAGRKQPKWAPPGSFDVRSCRVTEPESVGQRQVAEQPPQWEGCTRVGVPGGAAHRHTFGEC